MPDFAYVQDDMNPHILRMLQSNFSLDAVHILLGRTSGYILRRLVNVIDLTMIRIWQYTVTEKHVMYIFTPVKTTILSTMNLFEVSQWNGIHVECHLTTCAPSITYFHYFSVHSTVNHVLS